MKRRPRRLDPLPTGSSAPIPRSTPNNPNTLIIPILLAMVVSIFNFQCSIFNVQLTTIVGLSKSGSDIMYRYVGLMVRFNKYFLPRSQPENISP